jgi:hypothetical protein
MPEITINVTEFDGNGNPNGRESPANLSVDVVAELINLVNLVAVTDAAGRDSGVARKDLADLMAHNGISGRAARATAANEKRYPVAAAKPSPINIFEVRTPRKPVVRNDHVDVPFLFAIRGMAANGRQVKWIEEGTFTVQRIDHAPDYIVSLGNCGYGHPAAKHAEIQKVGPYFYASYLDHPDSPYVRTKVRPDREMDHFLEALAWRARYHELRDRSSLHPLDQLEQSPHTPRDLMPERIYLDGYRAPLRDVSFSGTHFGGNYDESPLYGSYEEACAAVGDITLRTSREEIFDEVRRLQQCFAWSDERLFQVVNEPKLVVTQRSDVNDAKVSINLSVREYPYDAVWFPLDRSEEARHLAEVLAAMRGTTVGERIRPFTIHQSVEGFDFIRDNVLQLLKALEDGGNVTVCELAKEMKDLAEEDFMGRLGDLRSVLGAMSTKELSAKARSMPVARTVGIAADALKVFLDLHGPVPTPRPWAVQPRN